MTSEFWGYKVIAALPDYSGKYRASFTRVAEGATRQNAEDAMKRHISPGFTGKVVGPLTREEWNRLPMLRGYAETRDPGAEVTAADWVPLA